VVAAPAQQAASGTSQGWNPLSYFFSDTAAQAPPAQAPPAQAPPAQAQPAQYPPFQAPPMQVYGGRPSQSYITVVDEDTFGQEVAIPKTAMTKPKKPRGQPNPEGKKRTRRGKGKKDEHQVPRKPTSYQNFCRLHGAELKVEHPSLDMIGRSRKLSEMWALCSQATKDSYRTPDDSDSDKEPKATPDVNVRAPKSKAAEVAKAAKPAKPASSGKGKDPEQAADPKVVSAVMTLWRNEWDPRSAFDEKSEIRFDLTATAMKLYDKIPSKMTDAWDVPVVDAVENVCIKVAFVGIKDFRNKHAKVIKECAKHGFNTMFKQWASRKTDGQQSLNYPNTAEWGAFAALVFKETRNDPLVGR